MVRWCGFTEAEGDCDDSDPNTGPNATGGMTESIKTAMVTMIMMKMAMGIPAAFGGTDCDESDPTINPDATETWYDGINSDCDGWSDYDADMDGYDSYTWWWNDRL